MINEKTCGGCRIAKPTDHFHKNKCKKDGLNAYCISCKAVKSQAYRDKNREAISRKAKLKYDAAIARDKRIEYKALHPNSLRNSALKYSYGITLEQYQKMLVDQNYNCAICKTSQEQLIKRLAVDHNHKTNEIRGLLCGSCNRALGLFKENYEVISSAAEYMARSRGYNEPRS